MSPLVSVLPAAALRLRGEGRARETSTWDCSAAGVDKTGGGCLERESDRACCRRRPCADMCGGCSARRQCLCEVIFSGRECRGSTRGVAHSW